RAEYAFEQLQGTGCRPIRAEGGFYVVLDCADWLKAGLAADSRDLARDILDREKVATVPGTDFGAPQTLRLSLCSARFQEAIDRLHNYFVHSAETAEWITIAAI
ncbi:MAG: aminotransferase class I/II-fold pyridoxal phosphate-dependent enzyme, partial [Gemmataceae bacterium]